jgi:hypothetical protein
LHDSAVFVLGAFPILKLQPVVALKFGLVKVLFDQVQFVVDDLGYPFAI